MNTTIFDSVSDFHTVFMHGLDEMLQSENLDAATFNLVFGNAILHHKERDMIARLEQAKIKLGYKIDQEKTDDNSIIFFQLKDMKLDWQNWTMIEDRKINSWNIQLNKFRILKPKGFGTKKVTDLFQKFDENDFNFNKVKQPTIWEGAYFDRQVSLYYNEFPYKDLQAILVLDPKLNKEQFLTKVDNLYMWSICERLKNLYNISIGYNSLGAFASVNHLHFHLMIGIEELTVVQSKWSHNGGSDEYPARVYIFEDVDKSWNLIETLHSKNIAYNILYTPGKIYVFPRKFQDTYVTPSWSTGFGWYEFSGNFIIYEDEEVNALTDEIIRKSLKDASVELAYTTNTAKFIRAASLADIKDGIPLCAEIEGQKIAIYKVNDKYYATSNICTHAGGPLCEGELLSNIITCPWHGSKFDVTTGQVMHPPAISPVKTFKTRVNGDAIEVEME